MKFQNCHLISHISWLQLKYLKFLKFINIFQNSIMKYGTNSVLFSQIILQFVHRKFYGENKTTIKQTNSKKL